MATKKTESRDDVSKRHRDEWKLFRAKFIDPLYSDLDAAKAKEAKALADILKVYQDGERRAYGFSDNDADGKLEVSWDE